MRRVPDQVETNACPFIDSNDPRCATHFTLGRLSEAFDTCLRRPFACSTFYRIALERRQAGLSLTINGVAHPAYRPLRPTGT